MNVRFYILSDESDVYEFPDNTSEEELQDALYEWIDNNSVGGYEIIEDD